jgi:uncharacterized protein involved in tolerance to divalent cations
MITVCRVACGSETLAKTIGKSLVNADLCQGVNVVPNIVTIYK